MTHDPNEWQQDLFDLAANDRIRIVIEGEMGDMDATLESHSVTGHGETVEEALREMMREYVAAQLRETP